MQRVNRAFLLLLPLMPFVGYINSFLTGVYVGYSIGFLATIITMLNLLDRRTYNKLPKYLLYYFLFVIYSIFINYYRGIIDNHFLFFSKNTIIYSFFIIFIIENTLYSDKYIKRVFFLLKISVIFGVFAAGIQLFVDKSFFINSDASGVAVDSFLGSDQGRVPSVNTFAGGLGFYLFLFSSILVNLYRMKKLGFAQIKPSWIIIYLALIGFTVFVGQNRWQMVAYLIILFQFSVYGKSFLQGSFKSFLYTITIIVTAYIILNVMNYDIDRVIEDRILQSDKPLEENTGYSRIMAYVYFVDFFPRSPILGTGPTLDEEIKSVVHTQVHVGWLSLLLYYGLIGGFLFICSVYFLGRDIYRNAKILNQYYVFFVYLAFIWMEFTLVYIHFLEWGFLLSLVFYNYQKQKSIREIILKGALNPHKNGQFLVYS